MCMKVDFFHMIEEYMICMFCYLWVSTRCGKPWGLGQKVLLSFKFCVYTHYLLKWLPNLISFSAFFKCHYRPIFLVTCIQGSIFRALSILLIIHLLLSYFTLFSPLDLKLCEQRLCLFILTIISTIASTVHLLSSQYFLMFERKCIGKTDGRRREGLLGAHKLVQVYRKTCLWPFLKRKSLLGIP